MSWLSLGKNEDLPLVAVMAAATTRGVKNIKLRKLALFKVSLPPQGETAETSDCYGLLILYPFPASITLDRAHS